jgi:ABC-type Zn uptake system ZnuABC Zn-binding protein ZnuA
MAVPLAKVMSLAAPDYQKEYTLNAKAIATHLRAEVTPGMRAALAERAPSTNEDKPAIPFITAHPAYQYSSRGLIFHIAGKSAQARRNFSAENG